MNRAKSTLTVTGPRSFGVDGLHESHRHSVSGDAQLVIVDIVLAKYLLFGVYQCGFPNLIT